MIFLTPKKNAMFFYIPITVLFFVLRAIFFAASFGGVEHDSGWYLGVAKNLALRGIYASYTNTISEEGEGAHSSIHGRFSVQDDKGFSYFPAGVTAGPGYIFPEAFFLKAFGNGFWQYRLWPLSAYAILLFSLFFIVWQIGGLPSLLIFQVWLWAVPQLTTTYAYESYSEDIAFLFLLLSFGLYYLSTRSKKENWFIFFSGLFLSFSFLTKNLFFLLGLSFLLPLLWEVWKYRKQVIKVIIRWMLFAIGFALPVGLYEGYRYLFLVSHFGFAGWSAINEDIKLTFQSGGSGITSLNLKNLNWVFMLKKINIWLDVGIKQPFLIWTILLLSPLVVFKYSPKRLRVLIVLFYSSLLISFSWFILISPTGWARHVWQGIVLGMIIVSVTFGLSVRNTLKNFKKSAFGILLITVSLTVLLLGVVRYESLKMGFNLNQDTIEEWRRGRFIRGLEGLPSHPILSLSDQKGLTVFFKDNIKTQDRVYYAGWFIHAEASSLVDKVFYTLDRYFALDQKNPDNGKSYLILGPYQQGPWALEPANYVSDKMSEMCEKDVFKNSSYSLCLLRRGLLYNNPAY